MESSTRTTLWAFLLIAGILVTAFFLLWHDDGSKISSDDYLNVELLDKMAAESSLLEFGPEDVVVSYKWSLFSGIHPAVTFRCRYNSPHKDASMAILCYRMKGSSEWLMADTRLRRDNTARLTLRDLRKNNAYECFFILVGKDRIIRSEVVTFTTKNH